MASFLAKLWARLNPTRVPLTIMFVGLDNSGKTSILNSLSSSAGKSSPNEASICKAPRTISTDSGDCGDSFDVDDSATIDRLFRGDDDFYGLDSQQGDFCDLKCDNDSLLRSEGSPDRQTRTTSNEMSSGNLVFGSIRNSDRRASKSSAQPTIGYNFERVQLRNLQLTVLDLSGQAKYRGLWQEFYSAVDGIVFVVDSSDLIRLVVARDELENMLSHPYFATLDAADCIEKPLDEADANQAQSSASRRGCHDRPAPPTSFAGGGAGENNSPHLAQKQLTISQGKLIQAPLDTGPLSQQQQQQRQQTNNRRQQQTKLAPRTTTSTSKSFKLSGAGGPSRALLQALAPASERQQRQQQPKAVGRRRTRVPILFLANKADLANSVKPDAIVRALNLSQLRSDRHPWFVQPTSVAGAGATQGVTEAFDWLADQLSLATATPAP